MRERLFVKLSTIVMRIISKSFEVSARKVTQSKGNWFRVKYMDMEQYIVEGALH